MVSALLRALSVDRFGITEGAAHALLAAGLVGGLLVVPGLRVLRRRVSMPVGVAVSSLANALLLPLLAWAPSFGTLIALRVLEGAADLVTLVLLLDAIGSAGPTGQEGRRFGIAGFVLMLGLACGAVAAGAIGEWSPAGAFAAGAVPCAVVAALAWRAKPATGDAGDAARPRGRSYSPWHPAAAMMFGDRCLAGVLSATGSLYLSGALGLSPARVGGFIGVVLGLMALGNVPMGLLMDRIGPLATRMIGGSIYGLSFVLLAGVVRDGGASLLTVAMVLMGVGGAALIPSALSLANHGRDGATDMGWVQVAGNAGYLLGIVGGGLALAGISDPASAQGVRAFGRVLVGFAGGYLVLNLLSVLALAPRPSSAREGLGLRPVASDGTEGA
jgi:MFS family permease